LSTILPESLFLKALTEGLPMIDRLLFDNRITEGCHHPTVQPIEIMKKAPCSGISQHSMDDPTAYLFVFDGFADWEPASALAELRRTFGFSVQTVGLTRSPIKTMGGLKILPDLLIGEAQPDLTNILILPGGDAWMRGEMKEVTGFIKAVTATGRPVAAICAATLSLAHAGLLDDHHHTSNGNDFIPKHVPKYRGHELYQKLRAVRDGNVITANGLAPFAFAAEIFRTVAPDRKDDIATYESLYSRGLLDD